MDVYKVKGQFKMGNAMQPFTKEFVGAGKKEVRECVYSNIGSKHGVSRRFIIIESMDKIPASEATDAVAKYKASIK